ncbi:hypothetical protein [Streptomyces goshikiensis]|uniref:hypothetical protein n=1 Tax=Streptomyces goshikiensis TaxID=1942 RepID=UPI003684466B
MITARTNVMGHLTGAPCPDDGLKSLYRDMYKRPDLAVRLGLTEQKADLLDRIASEEGRPEAAVQAEEAFALAPSYRPILDGKPPTLTGRPNTGTGGPLLNVPSPGSSTRATAVSPAAGASKAAAVEGERAEGPLAVV